MEGCRPSRRQAATEATALISGLFHGEGKGRSLAWNRLYLYGLTMSLYDMLLVKTDPNGDIPGCGACAPVLPTIDSPTPSVSSPTGISNSPTVSTSSPSPSSAPVSLQSFFVCGWPHEIYLPLVASD